MRTQLHFIGKLCLIVGFLFILEAMPAQALLDPVLHPKFVNPLPFPAVATPVNGNNYEMSLTQFSQDLGLVDPAGNSLTSTVWGYNGSYPGPTIEARTGQIIQVKWTNNLPVNHLFPIDNSIHWAADDYLMANPEQETEVEFNNVPSVTHLHGGHTAADSDGHPEAWYTANSMFTGSNYFGTNFTYENDQEAATLWYHDHTIGITRLNVYAGLAGFYLLRDTNEDQLGLPKGEFEIPLVIQDRVFDAQGQLVYPSQLNYQGTPPYDQTLINNSILPEMFGEFILVNGKAWPKLDVQPRKYRLRLLNGSDSRFYELKIPGVTFFQIGSDGGFLPTPVKRSIILLGPGERVDAIVDFSAPELWGQSLMMKNTARSPYPFGASPNPHTSGQIMAFNVIVPLVGTDSPLLLNIKGKAGPPTVSAPPTGDPRELVLFEQIDDYGRLLPSLGTATAGALAFTDPATETPPFGSTETWKIYNTTPDAHPIHLHLVHFQVLNTQKFDVKRSVFGASKNILLLGKPSPPAAENAGRKDTFVINPGEVATVTALFDKPGEYVWHCHILSHEDHDMMRPIVVGQPTAAPIAMTNSLPLAPTSLAAFEIAPNPVIDQTQVRFTMNTDSNVLLEVYDFTGRKLSNLYNGFAAANQDYELNFDRTGLPSGMYICKLTTSDGRSVEKYIVAE